MKKYLREKLGENYILLAKYKGILMNRINLFRNFWVDLILFYKHSNVYKIDTFEKIESKIILDYHGIEKGFLHKKIRNKFAKNRVESLLSNLMKIKKFDKSSSQIDVSKSILVKYYELHKDRQIDISEYFSELDFKNLSDAFNENPITIVSKKDYFGNVDSSFGAFSLSRKSVRSFKEDIIDDETIRKIIELSRFSPSVCNRQSSKVYFVKNYQKVQQILQLQGGLTGFLEGIHQLMLVTVDRNYFYTVGERNQFYIDGGLYLMNLLYSLHYNGIAACCANWGKEFSADRKIAKILSLKDSEKVICVVVVGYSEDEVKYTLSKRRAVSEILEIIN